MNITLSETFPIVIITLLVELFKQFGLPKGWEKPCAFILALVFGGIFLWKKDWLEIVKGILLYALGAVGLYENSIKLVKTGLK